MYFFISCFWPWHAPIVFKCYGKDPLFFFTFSLFVIVCSQDLLKVKPLSEILWRETLSLQSHVSNPSLPATARPSWDLCFSETLLDTITFRPWSKDGETSLISLKESFLECCPTLVSVAVPSPSRGPAWTGRYCPRRNTLQSVFCRYSCGVLTQSGTN